MLQSFRKASSPNSTTELITLAVGLVYVRYMEGYHIWKGLKPGQLPSDVHQQLRELALYNLVNQSAGTITHCSEKVCEVYDFMLVELGKSGASYTADEIFVSLHEIFKVLCRSRKFCILNQMLTTTTISLSLSLSLYHP